MMIEPTTAATFHLRDVIWNFGGPGTRRDPPRVEAGAVSSTRLQGVVVRVVLRSDGSCGHITRGTPRDAGDRSRRLQRGLDAPADAPDRDHPHADRRPRDRGRHTDLLAVPESKMAGDCAAQPDRAALG